MVSILPIEATHHVYRNLQSSDDSTYQPYRTAYHFQPPKNWINDNVTPADKGFDEVSSEHVLKHDCGKYYASKSFFDDEKNRKILLGWVSQSSSVADDIKNGGSGIHTIPRVIRLHKSGKQLVQWPIVEVEKLRANHVNWPTKILNGGGELLKINGVTPTQVDVEISFEVNNNIEAAEVLDNWTDPQILCSESSSIKSGLGPFGLLVFASKGLKEFTSVFFRIFKYQQKPLVLFCSDQSRSSLNNDNDLNTYGTFSDVDVLNEKLSLRSLHFSCKLCVSASSESVAGIVQASFQVGSLRALNSS
ncbi:unnamed protein product [Trifolium pratense]|uniref:Uncharacterized protein n=1 Tax=Trifolium pratense TaxID=57577 RepID=A0ACB0L5P6_TRIPR|nr:unnamed protein product [Trifolium pratense]